MTSEKSASAIGGKGKKATKQKIDIQVEDLESPSQARIEESSS